MSPDLTAALRALPHGAAFRFIDELTSLLPGHEATGRYLVRGDEAGRDHDLVRERRKKDVHNMSEWKSKSDTLRTGLGNGCLIQWFPKSGKIVVVLYPKNGCLTPIVSCFLKFLE